MNKVSGLMVKFTPSFLAAIDEGARKCFGNLPIETYRTGFKYLRKKPIGPMAVKHYLDDQTRYFRDNVPEFDTEIEERTKLRRERAINRGKVFAKKGQGKRAMRNQKKH
jgi:hypothetical protein